MSKFKLFIFALTFSFIAPSALAQQTVYVSDVIYVPMRSGAGIEYRIVNAAIKSGTKLTRMEQSEDGTWSRVVTEGGTEGWIRNQYLLEDQTAQIKLNTLLVKSARIEKENQDLKAKYAQLDAENRELDAETSSVSDENVLLSSELEKIKKLSANAIDLDRRYQALLEKHALTQTERDSLQAENENLKSDQRLSFMLYGAGILFFGMIAALIIPSIWPKKRYSDWA